MTFNTAIKLITSIKYNLDEGMRFTYDLTDLRNYKLTMCDCNNGQLRHVSFKLKKGVKKMVYVNFTCIDFRINFPLLKQVERFEFDIYDFTMLLRYGIKIDKNSSNELDLDVEF